MTFSDLGKPKNPAIIKEILKYMFLITGLGNPGEELKNTKHNLGFMVLEQLTKDATWQEKKAYSALLAKTIINGQETILAKPLTFMNNSGQAVKKIAKDFKIKPDKIIVIHDDLDLEIGKIKLSQNKNSGGHKGVQSIIDHIKSKNFIRIRIGIGKTKKEKTADFVLSAFSKKDVAAINQTIDQSCLAVEEILANGYQIAAGKFN